MFGLQYNGKGSGEAIIGLLQAFNVVNARYKDLPNGDRVIEFDQVSTEEVADGIICYTIYKKDWLMQNKITNKFFVLTHQRYLDLKQYLRRAENIAKYEI